MNKIKKTVLVTGGTGFIGRNFINLSSRRYKTRLFVRRAFEAKNCEVFVGDILNINDVDRAMKNIDCVVHLAAMILGNENDIYNFNTLSTKLLVDSAIRNKVNKFIFLSSENVLCGNQSAYGESKKKCEEIVRRFGNHLILRSAVVYGKESSVILGKVINIVKNNKFVLIPGDGESLMQPIFVGDVSNYLLKGLASDISGTYLIAGEKTSLNNFINVICRLLGVKRIKIHVPLFFMKLCVKASERIMKNPPLKYSQLTNLNTDRVYDISRTCTAFRHSPLKLEEGLEKAIL